MKRAQSVFVVATLALGAWASSALAIPVGNHYLCHKTRDLKVPAKFVKLTGQTANDPDGNFTCAVKKPAFLCQPADKNGSGIVDANLNYCCYQVKCDPTKIPTNYDITDQFGGLRLQTGKAFLICNPCDKAPAP
jgi:hypothetical protein